jgi:hypothetical protein
MSPSTSATPTRDSRRVGSKPGSRGKREASAYPSTQANLPLESQILKDVEKWMEIYQTEPDIQTSKARPIFNMISDFHLFCEEYIQELSKLSGSTSHPWLENTVDNVLLDYWKPILRSAEQNRADHYQAFFENGDKKLNELQKVLEGRLNFSMEDVHIVLYFDKTSNAERFPFRGTYLIGIPLIDAYRDDWMAIPHELGHHIYWNARFSKDDDNLLPELGTNFLEAEIEAAMQQLKLSQEDRSREPIKNILNDWTEEIFADVVGARIAGKEFCDAGWERIARLVDKKEDLFWSDGEHPFPYLLPYIRTAAAGIKFEDKWKKYFDLNDDEYTLLVSKRPVDEQPVDPPIKIEDLRTAVQAYAKNITAQLQKIEIDKLVVGPAPVDELKKFIRSRRKEIRDYKKKAKSGNLPQDQGIDEEKEMLNLLLTPMILEKHLDWICPRCGTSNIGDPCLRCGQRRPATAQSVLSYVVNKVTSIFDN